MNTLRPQSVNLYRRSTSIWVQALRAQGILGALALLGAGLALLTIFGAARVRSFESLVANVTASLETQNTGLANAGADYSLNTDFRRLQQRVERLQSLIARQDVVLGRIDMANLGAQQGFSKQLGAVAAARLDGVWLTQLELGYAPARFRMQGIAMQAQLVPRYLVTLGQAPELGMRRLHSLLLETAVSDERAASQGAVGFSIVQTDAESDLL
jgi:hypothetical protein